MYENYFIAGVCFFGIAQMFYTMSFGWEICNYVSMMMMVSANYILQVFFSWYKRLKLLVLENRYCRNTGREDSYDGRWIQCAAHFYGLESSWCCCCSWCFRWAFSIIKWIRSFWFEVVDSINFSGMERIYSLLGGIVFVISDLLIAVNQFVRPVPNHKLYVLSTYFFAQFCLAQWSICKAQRMPKIKSNWTLMNSVRKINIFRESFISHRNKNLNISLSLVWTFVRT